MFTPVEKRAVASLATLYVFRMLGLFMVLPVLMIYGASYSGASPALLGLALGIYGASQAVLQLPFGMLSDRIGRKPVIAAGLLVFALGSLLAASADSVWGLIAGRALQGAGAIASAITALVADLTREENRTKAMAAIGASIGLSLVMALVIGPLLAQWGGLAAIFYLTALLAISGLAVVHFWVPKARVIRHRQVLAPLSMLKQVIFDRELLRLDWGIFTLHAVLLAIFAVVPVMLEQQYLVARDDLWKVYLGLLGLSFLVMLPLIVIAERYRKLKPVFVFAVALLCVSLLGLGLGGKQLSFTAFMLFLFLFFIAFNLLEACLPSLVSKVSPAGAKGAAIGIYSSAQFFGAFAGGAGAGWLLEGASSDSVFMVSAGLVAIWLLVAATMRAPRPLMSFEVELPRQADGSTRADDSIEALLKGIPGVEEVLVVSGDATAFVRVDTSQSQLADIQRVLSKKDIP